MAQVKEMIQKISLMKMIEAYDSTTSRSQVHMEKVKTLAAFKEFLNLTDPTVVTCPPTSRTMKVKRQDYKLEPFGV